MVCKGTIGYSSGNGTSIFDSTLISGVSSRDSLSPSGDDGGGELGAEDDAEYVPESETVEEDEEEGGEDAREVLVLDMFRRVGGDGAGAATVQTKSEMIHNSYNVPKHHRTFTPRFPGKYDLLTVTKHMALLVPWSKRQGLMPTASIVFADLITLPNFELILIGGHWSAPLRSSRLP